MKALRSLLAEEKKRKPGKTVTILVIPSDDPRVRDRAAMKRLRRLMAWRRNVARQ